MTESVSSPRFEAIELSDVPPTEATRKRLLDELPKLSREIASNTISITFLAGAGTRWKASLIKAKENPDAANFPLEMPRGLFPVPDFLEGKKGARRVAMAAYAFDAVRRAERHIIVVRGWEREIDAQAVIPAKIPLARRVFFTQRAGADGQVHGHGDAALQCAALWEHSRYVITNFAGDTNSALTAELVLRAFSKFDELGIEIGAIIPVAHTESPSYPVYLDKNGFPVGFWHEKLAGSKPAAIPTSLTNVGIRVYRADWLKRALRELQQQYYDAASGGFWNIPGNDPSKHECALDNVDNFLAGKGLARVMPISLPRELTPLKALSEYEVFVRAIREVQAELNAVGRTAY